MERLLRFPTAYSPILVSANGRRASLSYVASPAPVVFRIFRDGHDSRFRIHIFYGQGNDKNLKLFIRRFRRLRREHRDMKAANENRITTPLDPGFRRGDYPRYFLRDGQVQITFGFESFDLRHLSALEALSFGCGSAALS